jgi:tetratricopeptide (TPR) repeat protein
VSDDTFRAAIDHHVQANRLRAEGQLEDAAMHERRAIAIRRGNGDVTGLAHALRHLADILTEANQPDEARPYLHEALGIYETATDAPPLDVANAMRSEAMRLWVLGDDEASLLVWQLVRERYAALDALFQTITGTDGNPGVEEADTWIARLENMQR